MHEYWCRRAVERSVAATRDEQTNMVNYSYNIYCNRARLFHFFRILSPGKLFFASMRFSHWNSTSSANFLRQIVVVVAICSYCVCAYLFIFFFFFSFTCFLSPAILSYTCVAFIFKFGPFRFYFLCYEKHSLLWCGCCFSPYCICCCHHHHYSTTSAKNWDNRPENFKRQNAYSDELLVFVLLRTVRSSRSHCLRFSMSLLLLLFSDVLCMEIYISIKPTDNAESHWWCSMDGWMNEWISIWITTMVQPNQHWWYSTVVLIFMSLFTLTKHQTNRLFCT